MNKSKFNAELRTALQKIKLANERLMSSPSNSPCETVNELKNAYINPTEDNTQMFSTERLIEIR